MSLMIRSTSLGLEALSQGAEKKIGSCFSEADESKIVNCVSVSATTQHSEAAINANNMHLDNQSRFCCQDLIFVRWNSGRFEHISPVCPQEDGLWGKLSALGIMMIFISMVLVEIASLIGAKLTKVETEGT